MEQYALPNIDVDVMVAALAAYSAAWLVTKAKLTEGVRRALAAYTTPLHCIVCTGYWTSAFFTALQAETPGQWILHWFAASAVVKLLATIQREAD